ncbi:histidine kinase [Sphingobacterium kitahiroshimense]|uniref:histidine kinase n=1 Tax=Sphingobacterium sp. B16(2022) TaxID=2914044 RepID=UPI00143BE790|nr:histidine kinase [Sphingobacterium sp. B16(2022)]NJI74963.1 histidine kinase [Sphingobacterium sp. B16(2022)]
MHRQRKTYLIGECLLAGVSIIFLAIYFYLVVPGYFNGTLDFVFLCLTYFSLYFSSRYILLPFVSKLYRPHIVFLAIGFLVLYALILIIVLGGSWLWGGLEWSEGEWDIQNFWHVFVIFLLPSIVGLCMYIWKVGYGDWKLLQESTMLYDLLLKAYSLLKVQLLQQELSPHFLNNTLTIIQPLVRRDPQAAINAMERCNRIFRFYMMHHGKKLIACQDELDQVELIRQIYELRKGKPISLQIRGDVAFVSSILVPPMLLINLVENAFQYGDLDNRDFPVCITVGLKDETIVMLEVINGLSQTCRVSTGTGTSQQRTKDLLKLLDPESGVMEIEISAKIYRVRIAFDMDVASNH